MIEEVVVTAQKREQAIMDVPTSVQALQGEELERRGFSSLKDVVSLIPGASVPAEIAPGTETYQMRGIASGQAIGDATVGAYLDEFAFSIPGQPFGPPADIYDVQRIEVLRGPQGTLYGQGSIGGVLKIVTADPEHNVFDISGRASYGKVSDADSRFGGSMMVNAPLLEDTLSARAVVSASDTGGFADAPLLGQENINSNKTFSGRAKLLYTPSDRLSVTGAVWRYESEQDYTNRIDGIDPPFTNDEGPGVSPVDWTLYSTIVEYDLGFASLLSSTGYIEQQRELVAIGSQPAFGDYVIRTSNDLESFSQELRLASSGTGAVQWIVGGFYQHGETENSSDFAITQPVLQAIDMSGIESTAWAVFGELSWELLDGRVVPLVGVRYYRDKRELSEDGTTLLDGAIVSQSTEGVEGDFDDVSFRFNVSYFPSPEGMIYVNAAEGFRSGALQTDSAVTALQALNVTATQKLSEDSLWSYEVGTKWALLNGALNLEAAAYFVDWSDAQLQFSPAGLTGILNFGDVEGRGLDITLNYATPIEGLLLSLSGNVNETEFKSVSSAIEAVLPYIGAGEQTPGVPKSNATIGLAYVRPLTSVGLDLLADVWYEYRGKQKDVVTGENSGTLGLISAQVGVETDRLSAQVFVDNLTNDKGPAQVASGRYVMPYPRTVGVRVGFNL